MSISYDHLGYENTNSVRPCWRGTLFGASFTGYVSQSSVVSLLVKLGVTLDMARFVFGSVLSTLDFARTFSSLFVSLKLKTFFTEWCIWLIAVWWAYPIPSLSSKYVVDSLCPAVSNLILFWLPSTRISRRTFLSWTIVVLLMTITSTSGWLISSLIYGPTLFHKPHFSWRGYSVQNTLVRTSPHIELNVSHSFFPILWRPTFRVHEDSQHFWWNSRNIRFFALWYTIAVATW